MNFIEIIKKHKIFVSVVLCVIFLLYAGFVFVLPAILNLNNYKDDIQKLVQQSVKLNLDFQDIKLVTTPGLKAGVNISGLNLSYPDGKNIAQLQNAQAKIELLPLVFKTVKISDIIADSPSLSVEFLADGNIDIVEYITKNLEQSAQTTQTTTAELPVKISPNLPVVTVTDYSLTFNDKLSSNSISIKGNNFIFDKAVLNKHFRVTTDGKILVNKNTNINYDIKFSSFWPVFKTNEQTVQTTTAPDIDFIQELVKYNPTADIKADIAAKEHEGHIDLDGYLNIDKLSIKLNGKKLPDSYFHLLAKGHETNIDSVVYVSKDEKAGVKSDITTGRKTLVDLNLNTDKISFSSIQNFAVALLNSVNMKNDLASLKVAGYLKSNFNIKTDLKKFESSGTFNIAEGSVAHKIIPVTINNITADIDFSNNTLNIKKAYTLVNGTKITAGGFIDSSSNTDISVSSGNINIAPLFNAFAPADMKKSFLLNSGILNIDVILKGKLSEIQPDVDVMLTNFLMKTRQPMPAISLNIPTLKVDVDPSQAVINQFDIIFNSSKIKVSGNVKDYLKDMKIDITADGSVKTNDINLLLPKEIRAFIGNKGAIPFKGLVGGNLEKIDIKAQAYPDSGNYFSPLSVKKMIGKTGLVNAEMSYTNDNLDIADVSLYLPSKSTMSEDFSKNKKGAAKIAGITGTISNISSNYPEMKIQFSIPEPVSLSHPLMQDASLNARGDLNIQGTLNAPAYKGFFSIKEINLPSLLTKAEGVDLEFNDNTITANIQNLDINKTVLNIIADASTTFGDIFVIKSMKLSSNDLNADNLFVAMDKMNAFFASTNQSSVPATAAPGNVLPVKISNGSADIKKFTMKQVGGNFNATNITGNFTLLNDLIRIPDLKATVYNGTVDANISYNLKTTDITAKAKGTKIDANQAVSVFIGLKDQVLSNMDFNADVKLSGSTYEQQMKSLNGTADFSLKDGQLGSLGRFESFLNADNLLSQSFVKTQLGSVINTISPYNTGKFSYLTGNVKLSGGNAILEQVKMSGNNMSLLLKGTVNILSMDSKIEILGSLSNEVVTALGPVSNLSVEKFVSLIPTFGSKIASAMNSYNEAANKTVLESIPDLTPAQTGTKSFKVNLNGNLNNPASAFDGFKWLNTPEIIKEEQAELENQAEEKSSTPVTKEELKQQVQQKAQQTKQQVKQNIAESVKNNEKVQKLQESKAAKVLGGIYNLYKNSKETTQNQNEQTQSTEPNETQNNE